MRTSISRSIFLALAPVLSTAAVSIPGLDQLKDNPSAKGRLLLNELQCAACHENPKGFAGLPARTAPDLSDAGGRLRADWVRSFIASPAKVAPGSVHPDILAGKHAGSAKVQTEGMTHYLMMLKRAKPTTESRGSADKGRDLYGKLGCAACHGSPDSLDPGAKYSSTTAFANFLQNPLHNNPGSRMPSLHLSAEEALDIATFLIKDSRKNAGFIPDFEKVTQGKSYFKVLNCGACHTTVSGGRLIRPEGILGPPPGLGELAGREGQGCLKSKPTGSWPFFGLDPDQARMVADALKEIAKPAKASAKERVAIRMALLNCHACHSRDGVGGPSGDRDKYFQTTQPAMGPEGRLPPHLDHTGAKLNPSWLKEVIGKGTKVRPYMLTRMPGYGDHNTRGLAEDFAAADKIKPLPDPPNIKIREALKQGRLMVGSKGLACVSCHTFGGTPSLGVQGMDLAVMKKRLQADWFRHYLVNPIAMRPGTRMPSFWPDGKSTKPEILDGDTAKQIEAIWKYLALGKKAAFPSGLARSGTMLVAGDEARIYRNFIQGAGARAIGVGFPGEVNLAWDANNLRPALIWQGDFIDASKHWVGRGSGFQGPAGINTLSLPSGLSLAILDDSDAPWPDTGGRGPETRFKGYLLDESRFPAFRYIFHGIEVTDYYEPFEAGDAFVLRRTLTLKGKPAKGLTYRAAVGENLQVVEPGGKFRIGDLTVTLTVSRDPEFKLRQGREITVPLDLSDGMLTVTQVYDW